MKGASNFIGIFVLRIRGYLIKSEIEKEESLAQIFWPDSSTICLHFAFCCSAALNEFIFQFTPG